MMWCTTTLLVIIALISEASIPDFTARYNLEPLATGNHPNFIQYITNKEYIQHIHSMIDAYKGGAKGRLVIETNALINTKYRTWKRNADLINSLLALPKGLNDAGR